MDYLIVIAGLYYTLVALKVTGRLVRVRFNRKEFWNRTMWLLWGSFIIIHVTALVFWIVVTLILTMVGAQN